MNVAITFISFTTSSRFTQMFSRDNSHRAPVKESITQTLWHAASKLFRGKEIFHAPGDWDITGHFLMGRTCAGSECSRNSGCHTPWDIVVDMTLVG
jgi:hypothetical protein